MSVLVWITFFFSWLTVSSVFRDCSRWFFVRLWYVQGKYVTHCIISLILNENDFISDINCVFNAWDNLPLQFFSLTSRFPPKIFYRYYIYIHICILYTAMLSIYDDDPVWSVESHMVPWVLPGVMIKGRVLFKMRTI